MKVTTSTLALFHGSSLILIPSRKNCDIVNAQDGKNLRVFSAKYGAILIDGVRKKSRAKGVLTEMWSHDLSNVIKQTSRSPYSKFLVIMY